MKQIVVLSGKGGTGKTSLSAAFAHLAGSGGTNVLVDADVDAANLELLLKARRVTEEPFWGGSTAIIDQSRCSGCGTCQEVCRFDAVSVSDGEYLVDPVACDGCAACVYACPEQTITLEKQQAGEWYISETAYGRFFHAHLLPAQENSGKLVAFIKRQAQDALKEMDGDLMLVDGPPGIGCPVISAISGADVVLIVTEPSLAGIHDLERVLGTAAYFQVPAWVCINKADLYREGAEQIRDICQVREIPLLGEISYDLTIPRAMTAGEPVTLFAPDSGASREIQAIWEKILLKLNDLHPAGTIIQL
ncbi:MAG: (4Fe-4S)-binding protein [Chloroflexi bacterium]|nr:MAG: (4Fe-4S)-binding protein [Chloroflexota bacterium]